jgi:hypothetical protein
LGWRRIEKLMDLNQIIHQRTMSEDERVEAEKKAAAMKTIDEDDSEEEEEDPQMLLREAKDWKVRMCNCLLSYRSMLTV